MKRSPNSHKGQNGRVLVVGGNELYHGAPILAGIGAERSGVDLVYLMVPVNQQHLARQFSPNLIVDSFKGKYFQGSDVKKVMDWTKKVDVMILGNGLGEKPATMRALKSVLETAGCKLVIDAAALQAFVKVRKVKSPEVVVTPHRAEFGRMIGQNLEKATKKELEALVKQWSKRWQAVIVLKTPQTLMGSPDGKLHWNKTGHPVMTKGGTGDVLAGLIAGLMAQGMPAFDAAQQACEEWGEVGEGVFKKKGLMSTIEDFLAE